MYKCYLCIQTYIFLNLYIVQIIHKFMPNNVIKSISSNMLNNFYSTFKYNKE